MLNIPIRERQIKETLTLLISKALLKILMLFNAFFFITKKLYNIFQTFVNSFFKIFFYRREIVYKFPLLFNSEHKVCCTLEQVLAKHWQLILFGLVLVI